MSLLIRRFKMTGFFFPEREKKRRVKAQIPPQEIPFWLHVVQICIYLNSTNRPSSLSPTLFFLCVPALLCSGNSNNLSPAPGSSVPIRNDEDGAAGETFARSLALGRGLHCAPAHLDLCVPVSAGRMSFPSLFP